MRQMEGWLKVVREWQKPPYHRSWTTTSHQIRIRNLFSRREIFQFEGSRFRPKALHNATAVPTIPPLPNMEVLGLPQTLRIIAITVDIPGDRNNSEWRASVAWFQMNRLSGQRRPRSRAEHSQYTRELEYILQRRAGEIFSLCVA